MIAPSIGSSGLIADKRNMRVKILHTHDIIPNSYSGVDKLRSLLYHYVSESPEGKEIMSSPEGRVTARFIIEHDNEMTNQMESFRIYIPEEIWVREEARIHTSAGVDVVYIGGNKSKREDNKLFAEELQLAKTHAQSGPKSIGLDESEGVTFERLNYPLCSKDVGQLLEMYRLCFTSFPVDLNEELVQGAAQNSIFFVARNRSGQIIVSTVGEHMEVGPITLLEISDVASHPRLRVKGAASGCAKRVINYGKSHLKSTVVPFWEARMWRNILGMGHAVGLNHLGGVLHKHCVISSTEDRTSLPQNGYGSLAVFYSL